MTDIIKCKSIDNVENNWCNETDIQNPKTIQIIKNDKNFSSDYGKVIQIKPQHIKMNLRVGSTNTFNFSFLGAKNYPVDLYFLLDASQSMLSTKKAVQQRGTDIHKTMLALTNNVFMGLGTFIDKNAMPFVL